MKDARALVVDIEKENVAQSEIIRKISTVMNATEKKTEEGVK